MATLKSTLHTLTLLGLATLTLAQDDGGSGGGSADGSSNQQSMSLPISHAVLMSAAFLLFYPLGTIIIRLGASWKIHAGWQILALALSIAGVGIGIPLADVSQTSIGNTAHTVIGLVVVSAILAVQPIGGLLQHRYFVKSGGRRGIFGATHVWFGRSLVALGIVNGGLGLQLAGYGISDSETIAYVVVAVAISVVYIGILAWDFIRTRGRSERLLGYGERQSVEPRKESFNMRQDVESSNSSTYRGTENRISRQWQRQRPGAS